MAKTEYTKEIIAKYIEEFINDEKNGFKKSNMTIDFMDYYVAWFRPETIDKWIEECLKIPMIDSKRVDKYNNPIMKKDLKAIRNLFINTYFAEYSDEAKKIEKEKAKKEREEKKRIKEEEKNMTPEEKLRNKLNKLKEENK